MSMPTLTFKPDAIDSLTDLMDYWIGMTVLLHMKDGTIVQRVISGAGLTLCVTDEASGELHAIPFDHIAKIEVL